MSNPARVHRVCLGVFVCLTGAAMPARAQSAPAAAPPAPAATQSSQATDDADRARRIAEADFTVTNLPTTLRLPRHGGSFRLTHRFLLNLDGTSFSDAASNIFGLDNGAVIGLEFRWAPIDRLQAVVHRSSLAKTVQFSAQYNAIDQGGKWPVSLAGIASVEGTNNFMSGEVEEAGHDHDHPVPGSPHKSPAFGGVISWRYSDCLAVYAVPMYVHHSAIVVEGHRNTGYLGVGGRLRLHKRMYVVAEVSPRIGGYKPGAQEFAFGFEGRAGGHMFQLTFTNSVGTTFGQISQGGFPNTIYMGFNLSRKFFQ
jgi:hypothetical protein